MKPKTELQKRVFKIHKKLPKLSAAVKKWFIQRGLEHFYYSTKNENICFACGKSFSGKHKKCPKCGITFSKEQHGRKKLLRSYNYFKVLDTFEGFQVIRCFFVLKWSKLGEKESTSFFEVYQHWILPDKGHVTLGAKINGMGKWTFNEGWVLGSGLEIRTEFSADRHYVNRGLVKIVRMLPEVKRNGYDGDTHELNLDYFLTMLLTNNVFETLLKIKNYTLLQSFYRYDPLLTRFWKQYVLCQRHKYKIKDLQMWLDHMALLKYFKYDIHSPRYVCSKSFEEDHQMLIERKRKVDIILQKERERRAKEREIQRNLKVRADYIKFKKKFFDILIAHDNITIVPFKSIDDFIEEGRKLHHCVYSSTYYSNKNTLILSARVNGESMETIEFSLREGKVLQCRGACNHDSKYHKKILNLINANTDLINSYNNPRKIKVA